MDHIMDPRMILTTILLVPTRYHLPIIYLLTYLLYCYTLLLLLTAVTCT